MQYIALDLETTGLKVTEHDVVEVAAIFDDLSLDSPPDYPPLKIIVVPYGDFKICPRVALMHKRIWELMDTVDKDRLDAGYLENGIWFCRPQHVWGAFWTWMNTYSIETPLTIAGKNPNFDKKFIESLPNWNIKIRHRMIDPSLLWAVHGDESIPCLPQCMERAGIDPSNLHTAYDDALAIRHLIRRHPWSKRFGSGVQQALETSFN